MFIFRLLSFIVFIILFLSSIFLESIYGHILFAILSIFLAYFAIYEFLNVLSKLNKSSYINITPFVGVLIIISIMSSGNRFEPLPELLPVFAVICWVALLFAKDKKDSLEKILNSSAALLLIVVPLCFLAVIYNQNKYLLLFLVLVTKTGDTAAYAVGMLSNKILPGGNHKIFPSISPKKSWEGTMGGLFFSIIVSVGLGLSLNLFDTSHIYILIIAGIILFIGGFAGDLAESSFKRVCGTKDSGNIIPGMGGALDVLDSLILNAPLFYYFCVLINKVLID